METRLKELQLKTEELERCYQGENTKVEKENKILLEKVKSLHEHQEMLRMHIDDKEKTIQSMLCKSNGNTPVVNHKSIQVENENTVQENQYMMSFESLLDTKLFKIEENMKQLNTIENKLESLIESKLSENMKTIDKKLREVIMENKTYAQTLKESTQSVSQSSNSTKTEGDFRSIIRDQRNDELIQEKERKGRSQNLIIHGVPELSEESEVSNKKAHDDEFVTSLLKLIDIDLKPKAITRLGNPNTKNNRPIKLVMSNEPEKKIS